MSSSYEECLKAMRDKALLFDVAISKVKKLNGEVVAKATQTLESITEMVGAVQPPKKCSVCYTREIQSVLAPCGHVFCTSCAGRAERTRCHTCRGRVDHSIKIFI